MVALKKAVYRYVEAELYDYPFLKKEINSLREDIIESGPILDGSNLSLQKTNWFSNTTLTKTTRLLTNRRLRRMEETVAAIEKILHRLPQEKLKLVELKYWDCRLTDRGIIQKLHVSPATYYRWRNDVIKAVAVELGLVNAAQVS